jgi:hypothetical protein
MRFEPMLSILAVAWLAACGSDNLVVCPGADGEVVCAPDSECLGGVCVARERAQVCEAISDEGTCTYLDVNGRCRDGYCQTELCGDQQLDNAWKGEVCDGALGRFDCADFGWDWGQTSCSDRCVAVTDGCGTFAWTPVRGAGPGNMRLVVSAGTHLFSAFRRRVGWGPDGANWRLSGKDEPNVIGDIVPLTAQRALLVEQLGQDAMLRGFDAATMTSSDTEVRLPFSGAWNGGVALDDSSMLASIGTALYRVAREGARWTATPLAAPTCAALGALRPRLRTTAIAVVGSVASKVVQINLAGTSATCAVLRQVLAPVAGVGGDGAALTWVADVEGRVYDAATWALRNTDPASAVAIDTAIAVGARVWASAGTQVRVFEGGSWWTSITGSTVLANSLGGKFANHSPLATLDGEVYAAQSSQDTGLVKRSEREWMQGWAGAAVRDVVVDQQQRPWALLDAQTLSIGTRVGTLSADLVAPLTSMQMRGAEALIGTARGVFSISSTFAVQPEGAALANIRGFWAAPDGSMYAANNGGLHRRAPGATPWTLLSDTSQACADGDGAAGLNLALKGAMVKAVPTLFITCRVGPVASDKYRLLVYRMPATQPAVLDLPNAQYTTLDVDADDSLWLLSGNSILRVAPPYDVLPAPIAVQRFDPITSEFSKVVEFTDLVVTGEGEVYLSGKNLGLYRWEPAAGGWAFDTTPGALAEARWVADAGRFVRISPSQQGSISYVALGFFGRQLYAAHENGVDLLLQP